MERNEKIFVANFKSLGLMAQALPQWVGYFSEHRNLLASKNKVIVAPPALNIESMINRIKEAYLPMAVAAQDVSMDKPGPQTGKISAESLAEIGVKYVIIGHSETRKAHSLTNSDIRNKIKRSRENNLIPIVCVKDTHQARLSMSDRDFDGIIAYEPIQAIGTGEAISSKEAEKVYQEIKKSFPQAKILYGGSVNKDNVLDFLKAGFDGVLVGQKSADPEFFGRIIKTAEIDPRDRGDIYEMLRQLQWLREIRGGTGNDSFYNETRNYVIEHSKSPGGGGLIERLNGELEVLKEGKRLENISSTTPPQPIAMLNIIIHDILEELAKAKVNDNQSEKK